MEKGRMTRRKEKIKEGKRGTDTEKNGDENNDKTKHRN
jgi:hypothetical protein